MLLYTDRQIVSGESNWVMGVPSLSDKVIFRDSLESASKLELLEPLLENVTVKVVFAWLLKSGGMKRTPTKSPLEEISSKYRVEATSTVTVWYNAVDDTEGLVFKKRLVSLSDIVAERLLVCEAVSLGSEDISEEIIVFD